MKTKIEVWEHYKEVSNELDEMRNELLKKMRNNEFLSYQNRMAVLTGVKLTIEWLLEMNEVLKTEIYLNN